MHITVSGNRCRVVYRKKARIKTPEDYPAIENCGKEGLEDYSMSVAYNCVRKTDVQ